MTKIYLDIYNNLIKLTRNKNLYNNKKQETFYDRLIILFFHLGLLLKNFKNTESKENLQNFFDYSIRQIELSIREIGYGDATINKKMKDFINILFSIIDKIDSWEKLEYSNKVKIVKYYIEDIDNIDEFINYFDKYTKFLSNNTFNNLSKDILNF